ncbi:MAG: class I SAM-dependent methyltransferase [Patescibacteria group bacterium]|nr:class I SAM-dependent methyltransferase [Patescibacteria group bacterium]MDD4610584.1 class I SAM-dependent methyltransferase [Patescibacteria group bacterium]
MDKQTQKQLLNIIKKGYEKEAEKFSETRKRHLSPLWNGLVEIAKDIKEGDKIFDAGCGNGRLLQIIGEKKIEYLGVDASERLINLAKELYPDYRFTVSDIFELSKLSEINFDYVFSVAVLHHIPGEDLRVAALKQLKNKIADNGKIVIVVWNLWSQKKYRKLIWKFALLKLFKKNNFDFGDIIFMGWIGDKNGGSERYYHAFTRRELKRISKKAGLNIEKIYKDSHNYYLILRK